ncbi:MAG: hypothetical protein IPL10_12545 [Bacteroidetes bacterium]|nr:hypothetical protein [Bacteroidota bacterium]
MKFKPRFFLFTLILALNTQNNYCQKSPLNIPTFYTVNCLNSSTISNKKDTIFNIEKDSVFYIYIGLCESIFLNDYLHNYKTLVSKNYLYNGQPAYRELEKENLSFYKSIYKKHSSKKIVLKHLWRVESYEKSLATINYLSNSNEIVPDSLKKIMKLINEVMFLPFSDEDLKASVKNILNNFKNCKDLYQIYFKEKYALVAQIILEMEMKFNYDPEKLKNYKKELILNELGQSKSIIIIATEPEKMALQSLLSN